MRKLIYKITHPFVRLYWKIFKPKTYGSRALVLYNNQILLVKNINVNHWSLPGGKIDYPENPEQCVLRELKEELGLSISNTAFKLGEYISQQEGKKDTVYIFVINLENSKFKKQWELEDARWFDFNYLPSDISPAASRRITEYFAGKKELMGAW